MLPSQAAGRQWFGNTHVPAFGQMLVSLHVPPVVQVPSPQLESRPAVQLKPLFEQCAEHWALLKQLPPVPAHVPGLHLFDAHEALPVHACPTSCSGKQTARGVNVSQNRPFMHCVVDEHGWPEATCGAHVPRLQYSPDAQPAAQG
jgi:hypothetical protein